MGTRGAGTGLLPANVPTAEQLADALRALAAAIALHGIEATS